MVKRILCAVAAFTLVLLCASTSSVESHATEDCEPIQTNSHGVLRSRSEAGAEDFAFYSSDIEYLAREIALLKAELE